MKNKENQTEDKENQTEDKEVIIAQIRKRIILKLERRKQMERIIKLFIVLPTSLVGLAIIVLMNI